MSLYDDYMASARVRVEEECFIPCSEDDEKAMREQRGTKGGWCPTIVRFVFKLGEHG